MSETPDTFMIDHALRVAALSPCRSKRGVVLYDLRIGAFRGQGFNGPPQGCPGRSVCAGTCGKRAVHAEIRALREATKYIASGHPVGPYDLIHVEIAADGGVVACSGPSCPGCAAQILDFGFVGSVWLYEINSTCPACQREEGFLTLGVHSSGLGCTYAVPRWRRYTASEFYETALRGVRP